MFEDYVGLKTKTFKPEMVIYNNEISYDVTDAFFKCWELGEEPRIRVKKECEDGKKQRSN